MFEKITTQNFYHLLGRFSTNQLEDMAQQFPYFHQAHLMLAKKYQQEGNPKFDEQLQLAVLYSQDREFLYSLFKQNKSAVSITETPPPTETENLNLPKEEIPFQEQPEVTIEGKSISLPVEGIVEEKSIEKEQEIFTLNESHTFDEWLKVFNPISNLKLEVVEETVSEKKDEELEQLIISNLPLNELVEEEKHYSKGLDKFIEEQKLKHKAQETTMPVNENELSSELITETIAKVYEAQKKYAKAIKAYEILALKYPEKNDFFATRIIELKNII